MVVMILIQTLYRWRDFVLRYERPLAAGSLLVGFIFDYVFFRRVDLLFENLAIIAHLVLGLCAILLIHLTSAERRLSRATYLLVPWLPLVMQFAIGGLFGKFFIFYFKSGTFVGSWPFLLVLFVLFIANEFLRDRYTRLNFRLGLFFVAVITYTAFAVPVLLRGIGPLIFIASGLLAVLVMILTLALLRRISGHISSREWRILYSILVGVYLIFNVFYFTNIIPPIPLAMKDGGVYHQIERKGDTYLAKGEASARSDLFGRPVYHRSSSDRRMYVFSSIFAPTGLTTVVYHHWYYFHDGKWDDTNIIPITITGGRDEGFRGYTFKSNPTPGSWRVDVETERGQLLGRIRFDVVTADTPIKLTTEEL